MHVEEAKRQTIDLGREPWPLRETGAVFTDILKRLYCPAIKAAVT
jgi:hypothetical protein